MDWGQARPYACLWFAVDFDGNLYCYRELYGYGGKPDVGTGETARQVGERIASLETRDENVSYGVLDSACCWARTGVTGPTIQEELNNVLISHKLVSFSKSSKGRLEGANQFKQRLIGNKLKDGSYKPAIYFFSNCIHTCRTIPMLSHDKHDPEKYDTSGEDHCFIAGTMISTRRGDIPIEQVTTDDYVLTRKGYRKVLLSAMTRQNADVITIEFSNGTKLTGTGNHPIYIKGKGFIPLDTICYSDIIYSVSEVKEKCQENRQQQQIQSYSTELPLDVIQAQKDCQTADIIEQTADLENKESPICTVKCGNSTMEKSPKAITSTTLTKTHLITTSRILNCSKEKAICCYTQSKISAMKNIENKTSSTWIESEKKQQNGIDQKKGANGTDNTVLKLQQEKPQSQRLNALALFAEKNMKLQQAEKKLVNSVHEPVVQNTDETTELTTKRESVQFVARNIEQWEQRVPYSQYVVAPKQKELMFII